MSLKRLAYLLVFTTVATIAATTHATIIWDDCPVPGTSHDTEVCPDDYDYSVCGVGGSLNACNCDHHGGTWSALGECED